MFWMFLIPLCFGREVLLRNDLALDDSFDEADEVVWLEYPQCAVAVLEAAPEDLPLEIHTVHVYLGSLTGSQDRQTTMLTLAMHVLDEGEDPRLMGLADWDWPETAFWVTVSSENLNALYLDDGEAGIYPFTLSSERLAVFVCTPDTQWKHGTAWPCETEGEDCSGLVVETGSPSEGSWWIDASPEALPMADLGVEGAWVIRALGEAEGPDDTGQVALGLDALDPSQALLGQVEDVTLSGQGFQDGAAVSIGGLALADLTWVDEATLTGRSPSGLPVGEHDVVVNNPDGESALLEEGFAVVEGEDLEPGGCGCGGASGGGALAVLVSALCGLVRRRRGDGGRV